jgi:hypothetical protein
MNLDNGTLLRKGEHVAVRRRGAIPRIGYRILSACPASEESGEEVSPKLSLAVLPFANLRPNV